MEQSLSLYIPHVFENISEKKMKEVFEDQGLGKVKNIDFIEKMDKNGKIYKTAFVHFECWYDSIITRNFQERIKNPNKEARIVYNDPWFWVCFENKGKKHIPGERKERINLHDFSNIFEEEKNDLKIDQETEDNFERELLEEFDCNSATTPFDIMETVKEYDLILYQKAEKKYQEQVIDMEYVKKIEMLNYKLVYDLYQARGDFIMV
jgi:hypothetical protein